jgi:hypothetical protein
MIYKVKSKLTIISIHTHVLPTKSDIKQHVVHNIHRLAGVPMVVGPPGNCPVFPCVKKALVMLL